MMCLNVMAINVKCAKDNAQPLSTAGFRRHKEPCMSENTGSCFVLFLLFVF